MNKKILVLITIIIAIILFVVVAGLIFYYLLYYEKPEEEVDLEDEDDFSIIKAEPMPYEEDYRFNIGTAEFVIYVPDLEAFEFGYFEAYNNGEKVYSTTPLYMIMDLLAFEYNGNKYIIISEYSGGAHCCFEEYIFLLDKNNDLELIGILDLGNTHILEDSLFMEDDDLYIKIFDDRFAYFYTPYVNSYFFIQYLKIEQDNLIASNNNFQEDYLKEAIRCEDNLKEQLEQEIEEFESYSPLLVCITVNYLLAGQEQKAWQEFEQYSVQVPLEHYGTSVNLEDFKQGLIELYQSESIPIYRLR